MTANKSRSLCSRLDSSNPAFDSGPAWQETLAGGFGVGGSFWLIDLSGDIASLDSIDFHLLVEFNDFLPEGTNSATHGIATSDMDGDGNIEFYIADLDARRVWQVEYQGGDISSPASYATKEVMRFPDGTQPKTLIVGQDMDNDGRLELVIQGPPGTIGSNILVLESTIVVGLGETPGTFLASLSWRKIILIRLTRKHPYAIVSPKIPR